MTTGWVVAALMRLYPAAWRREYGEELTAILLERPLGARVIADVAWNGFWQRTRAAEPSTILGVAVMLGVVISFVVTGGTYGRAWVPFLQATSRTFPPFEVTILASEIFAYLLVTCGCWTHLRHRGKARESGVAAMRMSAIASMPVILIAVLMMAGLLELTFVGPRLPPPSPLAILLTPLVRLPGAWIYGALGGQLGKWIVRRRRAATPAGLSG